MEGRYCWICDRPVDEDPCPTCGTPLYSRPEKGRETAKPDEVLDTASLSSSESTARSPVVIALVLAVVLVVIVVVFQAAAGIS